MDFMQDIPIPLIILILIYCLVFAVDIYLRRVAPKRNQNYRCPYCNNKLDLTKHRKKVRVAAGLVYAYLCLRCDKWHSIVSRSVWIILIAGFIGTTVLVYLAPN